jgi:hypothetical protein
MAKDDQILIRLEEKQKEKWKKHARENDRYRDLTNLVEQSVEERISTDSDDNDLESELMVIAQEIESLEESLGEIKEINERIEDTQSTSLELERTAERLENLVLKEEQKE